MSSKAAFNSLVDKLQRAYAGVLLQISHSLEKGQQDELRFYWTGLISKRKSGALSILRSLESAGKISWQNVSFLKEGLREVQRQDLCKILTAFEIKRDLILLLDVYARKKCGMESLCGYNFYSVEKVANYLVMLMTQMAGDHCNAGSTVGSLVESAKSTKQVLAAFEEDVECKLKDPWSKLTLLVVITGEILAASLARDEQCQKLEDVLELNFIGADELCSRMTKLGSWEEFCDHVEQQYCRVHRGQHNSVSDESSLVAKKKIADVVDKLKETQFFL